VNYSLGIVIGTIVGVLTGAVFARLPIAPMLQSVAAGTLGSVLSAVTSAVVWLVSPPSPTGIKAVSVGGAESVIMVAVVGAGAAALHLALGQVAERGWPSLATHRVIIASILGSLWGSLSFVAGRGLVMPLGK